MRRPSGPTLAGMVTGTAAAFGVLAVLLPGGWTTPHVLRDVVGGAAPPPTTRGPGRAAETSRPPDLAVAGTMSPQAMPPSTPAAGGGALTGAPYLAIGSERDNRVVAASLADLRDDLDAGRARLTARVLSPETGAPFHLLALPGLRLVVASTNHAELVLLTDRMTRARPLNVRATVDPDGRGPFRYGAMALDGTTLYVGAAWGNSVAVVTVDTEAWRVTGWRRLPGRYGQFPHVCLTRDKTLAVVTTEHLSLVRAADLRVLRHVRIGGHPVGLACLGDDVFLSDFVAPIVYRYTSAGTPRKPLRYDGTGASVLYAAGNAVYLGDEDDSNVVRCPVGAGGACTESRHLGGTVASLIRVGDLLFAARDFQREVTVLDPETLTVVGVIPVPGGPRGLALMVD